MEKEIKKQYYDACTNEDIRLLYSADFLPCNAFLYIYQDVNSDFIKWFEMDTLKANQWEDAYHHLRPDTYRDIMESRWLHLVKWMKKFSQLLWEPFATARTSACAVETRQNYSKWSKKDIIFLLECLAKASGMLYSAERDYFIGSHVLNPEKYYPLACYYIDSLEYIAWITASFVQGDSGNFIDLITKLKGKAQRNIVERSVANQAK